jgi:hypothetical protein
MNQVIRQIAAVEIIRQAAAVVVASALVVGATTAFAESANWSDRFGLGLFFVVIGAGIVTMIHCHRTRHF